MEIVLGQLGSNGDCLYATALAKQIKIDNPKCKLTWSISSLCTHLLENNPYVDCVWEWKVDSWQQQELAWKTYEREAMRKQETAGGEIRFINSQIWPNNFRRFDGTVRSSILRAYDQPVQNPFDLILELTDQELTRVEMFWNKLKLKGFDTYVLFECSSKSGQSYVTPEFALQVSEFISQEKSNVCVILSSHHKFDSGLFNVVNACELTIRENSKLLEYVDIFVGCGSGLTVLSTMDKTNSIPNLQILSGEKSVFGSFFHDYEYYGLDSTRFIEMYDVNAEHVSKAIITILTDGFINARERFHHPVPIHFSFYKELLNQCLVNRGWYLDALESVDLTISRYGPVEQLTEYADELIKHMGKSMQIMDNGQRKRTEEIYSHIKTIV